MKHMQYFVEKYVKPPCTVADVGSYDVNGSYRKLFDGCEYLGLDTHKGPNVDVIVEPYDFGDYQYDVVVSGQVLEHVEDMHRWRDAVLRIIRPGGLLCVIAPHSWGLHRYPKDCWRIFPDGMEWLFQSLEILECFMGQTDTVLIARKS
jgi:SAM-dependent methyltransferase